MAGRVTEVLGRVIGFQLWSVMFVSMMLFVFGIFNDEIMSRLYEVSLILESSAVTPAWVSTFILSMQDTVLMMPQWIDLMWLVMFSILISELWVGAYFMKREGYGGSLGLLTLGSFIVLLFTGIVGQMSDWFQFDFLGAIMPNISLANTYIMLYLENILVVNLFVCVVAIILNFIDLDIIKFSTRKKSIDTKEIAF